MKHSIYILIVALAVVACSESNEQEKPKASEIPPPDGGQVNVASIIGTDISADIGNYRADQIISIRVPYSTDVDVTGNPSLKLRIGSPTSSADATADYSADNPGSVLVFNYRTFTDHRDADGIEVLSLNLNGATIKMVDVTTDADNSFTPKTLTGVNVYQENTVSFTNTIPTAATYGSNVIGADASCRLSGSVASYGTSDTNLLSVDSSTGGFTALSGTGTATVVATCPESTTEGYYESTSSYTVMLSKATLSLDVRATFDLTYDVLNPVPGPAITINDLVTGDSVTLSYSSSNPNAILVNANTGELNVNSNSASLNFVDQTADIIVSFAGSDNYNSASTTYTVTIVGDVSADNLYADAHAVYSLRKVVPGYTGDAIRVLHRRSDTSEEQKRIGFDATGGLDMDALRTLVDSTGDAYVIGWYDQSGNRLDVSLDAEASNLPKIAADGRILLQRNKPVIQFYNGKSLEGRAGSWTASLEHNVSAFFVSTSESQVNDSYVFASRYVKAYFRANGGLQWDVSTDRLTATTVIPDQSTDQYSLFWSSDSESSPQHNIFVNGSTTAVATRDPTVSQPAQFSQIYVGGRDKMQELVIFLTNKTAEQRIALEDDQEAYWQTPAAAP